MTLATGFLLLLWVTTSILANGIALVHRFTKLRGLELIGYGAGAGILGHAVVGWAIAAAPGGRWLFVAILIASTLASAVYLALRGVFRELLGALSLSTKVSLGLWFLFLAVGLGLLHAEVAFPDVLPDGLFIFKTHTTNVKVQCLTGLPADNYIPFAVAEYFLRGVSFRKQRPILPANEVSNRTILMSLVTLPFRVVLGVPRDRPRLGTYRYIGRDWPDVAKLNTNNAFEEFAVIALFLNSLLLVGLFVFCSSLGANAFLPWATVLYITTPYFIAQAIYSWPKALAGFFILLAWNSIRAGHGPIIVAALMALAYHSHPYAIVFAGCVGLFYLSQWRHEERRLPSAVLYGFIFAAIVAPWFIWTKLMLQIPSDLIAQNFAGAGTDAAWASPVNFLWIRFHNLFCLVSPMMFSVYPFDYRTVLDYWLHCLPGVVGLVIVVPALLRCVQLEEGRAWLWYGLVGPALLIVLVYSTPASPILHGFQSLAGVLLCFGVWWLWQNFSRKAFLALIGFQLLINLSLVVARGFLVGVRFY